MPFWRFQLFSVLGALGWATVLGVAGYLLGDNIALIAAVLRAIGIGGLVFIAVVAVTLIFVQWRAARR
ncbi:MAG TPA: DedA family protein, partial [Candidatus Limnocylindria bacterium]|nr:DedA family protein [Candidatus Limnocylindria bacterium]